MPLTALEIQPPLPDDAPYSRGIRTGNLIFVHGQTGRDPDRGVLVDGGIGPEAAQTLRWIEKILERGGATLSDVVKVTCYVRNLAELDALDSHYLPFFASPPRPARTVIQVSDLHHGAAIEMDAIAVVSE